MKKIRSAVFTTAIMLLAIFSLIIAANAGYSTTQQEKKDSKISGEGNQPLFFAEISFYVYVGDGCACEPIPYTAVEAYGRDTDHFDTNFTDSEGFCILRLEYDATYRVTIEVEDFSMVMFDFMVIDDQPFTFHMQEEEDSATPNVSLLYNTLQRINRLKNL
jgi:hypothetical protein